MILVFSGNAFWLLNLAILEVGAVIALGITLTVKAMKDDFVNPF